MSDRRRLTRSQNDVPSNDNSAKQADHRDLRRRILEIQNDPSLTASDKARRTQALMLSRFTSSSPINLTSSMSSLNIPEEDVMIVKVENEEVKIKKSDFKVTWHDKEKQIMGCKHYHRGNKLQADCCKKWFTCRLCHDDEEDHKIDRYATKNMLCMRCNTVQRAAKTCINCKTDVAKYFCGKCKLWSDDPEKSIYHCDGCGVCRVGLGPGIDYFHCEKCCACLAITMKNSHRCIEQRLKCDCPICFDFMFDSTKEVIIMPCGHAIHRKCYKKHLETGYQCPVCLKSLGNMQESWAELDAQIMSSKMPANYSNHRSHIFCNDCEKKSHTIYHWVGHKCQHCGSYNTSVLKTYVKEDGENDEASDVAESESTSSSTPSSLSSSTSLSGTTPSPSSPLDEEDSDSETMPTTIMDTLLSDNTFERWPPNIRGVGVRDREDDCDEKEEDDDDPIDVSSYDNSVQRESGDEKANGYQKEKEKERDDMEIEGNEKKRRKERHDDGDDDTLPSSRFRAL
eukprot:TRINITY_DN4_c0_g1_i1.p1 TRINITY_DN4_c0_g1~~TRINITY_DN4_c0_g1_i1.p1  ORF type:complete len:511 (-),score=85.66 TRINITY_DN4_c0_g1_i1:28-1560(-)